MEPGPPDSPAHFCDPSNSVYDKKGFVPYVLTPTSPSISHPHCLSILSFPKVYPPGNLWSLPSKHLQNPTSPHHFHFCYHHLFPELQRWPSHGLPASTIDPFSLVSTQQPEGPIKT